MDLNLFQQQQQKSPMLSSKTETSENSVVSLIFNFSNLGKRIMINNVHSVREGVWLDTARVYLAQNVSVMTFVRTERLEHSGLKQSQ